MTIEPELMYSLPALFDTMSSHRFKSGEGDDKPYMRAIIEALRHGRSNP